MPSTVSQDTSGVTTKTTKKHIVKSRESISSISDKYGVSIDAILWANDLEEDDDLKIGQILKIPPVSGVVHTVVGGDTISEIAKKYHVTTTDIVSVNNLRNSASIRTGMNLMIPGAIKKTIPVEVKKPEISLPKTNITKVATVIKDTNDAKIIQKEPPVSIVSKSGLKERYAVKYTGLSRGFVG